MPMVWYIPPLSPVVDALTETGHDGEDVGNIFGAIESLRIPVEYLAELFTAGDTTRVTGVLRKLGAMRSYMRDLNLGRPADESIAAAVGMTGRDIQDMHRLLAVAKYDERYVIPLAHAEQGPGQEELDTGCSLDYDGGPGMGGWGPFGETSGGIDADRGGELPHARGAADQPTPWPRPGTRPAGQPAQLGRQGRTGGPVPATTGRATAPADGEAPSRSRASRRRRPPTPSWRRRGRRRRSCSAIPTSELLARLPLLRAAVAPLPDALAGPLGRFLDHVETTPLTGLQADYVETFDLRRRCCLYLTYFAHGDTRKRGMALLQFKHLYRRAGMTLTDEELPDHLAVVLEFAATGDAGRGERLLTEYRRRARADPAGPGGARLAVRRGAATRSRATLPPVDGRRSRGGAAAGRSRARPARRSASTPTAPLPFAPPEYMPQPATGRRRSHPMSAVDIVLWVVLPYISLAIFVVGHYWRYRYDKFGWTTRSSQLYERRLLRWGSPLFHFGILFVARSGTSAGWASRSPGRSGGHLRDRVPRRGASSPARSPGSAPWSGWRS